MSDTIKIGNEDFVLDIHPIKRHQRVKGADGKTTVQEVEHQIVTPPISTVADLKRLFGALLDGADAKEAGNGVKLGQVILLPRIEDASEASFDLENNTENPEKYVELAIAHERARSSGLGMEAINKEIADLTPEYMMLEGAASDKDAWSKLVGPDGGPLYTKRDDYILRLVAIKNRMIQLVKIREEKMKKSVELRAKREEKARAAAAKAADAAAQQAKAA